MAVTRKVSNKNKTQDWTASKWNLLAMNLRIFRSKHIIQYPEKLIIPRRGQYLQQKGSSQDKFYFFVLLLTTIICLVLCEHESNIQYMQLVIVYGMLYIYMKQSLVNLFWLKSNPSKKGEYPNVMSKFKIQKSLWQWFLLAIWLCCSFIFKSMSSICVHIIFITSYIPFLALTHTTLLGWRMHMARHDCQGYLSPIVNFIPTDPLHNLS